MKHRKQAEWLDLFESQKASGLSVVDFCNENSLCPKYFRMRRRKFLGKESNVRKQNTFVRAIPATSNIQPPRFVLRAACGELSFPDTTSPKWLASFIKALT